MKYKQRDNSDDLPNANKKAPPSKLLLLPMIFLFIVIIAFSYDSYTINKNSKRLTNDSKILISNYEQCFEDHLIEISSKPEGDVYILSDELFTICSNEILKYKELLSDTMGLTGYFGWYMIEDDIKNDAFDKIIFFRSNPTSINKKANYDK